MQNNIESQIYKELQRRNVTGSFIGNVQEIGDTGLINFTIDGKSFWATLTPTGKLKKNSIRINNF